MLQLVACSWIIVYKCGTPDTWGYCEPLPAKSASCLSACLVNTIHCVDRIIFHPYHVVFAGHTYL